MDDQVLLKIARDVITSELEGKHLKVEDIASNTELLEKGAVFITLTQGNQLRGCIGSLGAYRSLGEDLIENAKAAAFEDPRFYPLSKEELPSTQIEVSVLTEPIPVYYTFWEELKEKIMPYEDGVILKLGNRQATFLPQVWEQLPDFESFFTALAQKAGIVGDIFSLHPEIHIYKVRKIKE